MEDKKNLLEKNIETIEKKLSDTKYTSVGFVFFDSYVRCEARYHPPLLPQIYDRVEHNAHTAPWCGCGSDSQTTFLLTSIYFEPHP